MKTIRLMRLEVKSLCQYDCEMCAHGDMRKRLPDFDLSLNDLNHFLGVTRDSDYFINNVRIHGGGEPLLWEHFNEGVLMIKESGVVGSIFVATNGHLLSRISEAAWNAIDDMRISLYDGFTRNNMVDKVASKFPDKIEISKTDTFRRLPNKEELGEIPCRCMCDGPMLLGDKIYLYCGPPVFSAARLLEMDALSDRGLFVDVEKHYMDSCDESKIGNLDYCKKCWANENLKLDVVKQSIKGGNWRATQNFE